THELYTLSLHDALPILRLNEVMAENFGAVTNGTTTNSDWIELYNSGASAANLANWSLSNRGNARKYVYNSIQSELVVVPLVTARSEEHTSELQSRGHLV